MYRILLPSLILFSFFQTVFGQSKTWSNSAADIIYTKCTSCHRENGVAPFTLESYEEVVARGGGLQEAIENGKMPPWPPDQNYQRYAHERCLSAQQKIDLVAWFNEGMPRGNQNEEPHLPVFPTNGSIKEKPDLSLMAPMFTLHATQDIYQCFVVSNPGTTEKFIKAMEVIPGNRNIVHHVLVYQDTTGACRKLDDATPEPGYVNFGGVGSNSAQLIGAWVPGSTPAIYPDNMGIRLAPKGDIIIQVHYPVSGDGQSDQTQLNIYFAKASKIRTVFLSPLLSNYAIFLPKNTVKTLTAEFKVPNISNFSVLNVAPHMHLIGNKINSYAVGPQKDTLKFININNWNFHWQGSYEFKKPMIIKGGSTLYTSAEYDNTTNNPSNPNTPPKNVSFGEATTDEMLLVYFSYMIYQPGDENIDLESIGSTATKNVEDPKNLTAFQTNPNVIQIEIAEAYLNGIYSITDLEGNSVWSGVIRQNRFELGNIGLVPGVYALTVSKAEKHQTCKFVIHN